MGSVQAVVCIYSAVMCPEIKVDIIREQKVDIFQAKSRILDRWTLFAEKKRTLFANKSGHYTETPCIYILLHTLFKCGFA